MQLKIKVAIAQSSILSCIGPSAPEKLRDLTPHMSRMDTSQTRPAAFGTYRAKAILGIVVAFIITSTVSMILRFVGKKIKKTNISSEDWFIIAAQVTVYGLALVAILGIFYA
ncbi:hypothetical protein K469DRAFT_130542 [Zopfia rhizophila CBS 207.26]|uniref:Uncharacterized protein n=1 Tax=Zopfia rhizophila CBS 207.26 TaxID=1314779 RepID=A0A6A6EWW0_9PEZI|nr:hypothetical protein K469DRAFT_130542 [Zopfia rhizophila CBS 207.26]